MSTQANKVQRICAKCGATVFADSPRGYCSVCLFKTGLGPLDEDYDGEQEPSRIQMEFGDYQLLEEIGRGGQGVVYRARQKSLNRTVALKVIGLGQWSSTPHLRRFRHEAEAAASLEHPQIVPIYEIGERDGACYFSMKFVEGGLLDEVVKGEPMPARRAAELLVKIARTVHFAHEHGILHRDIKPGNILLDKNGEPHLTDFGLARLIEHESTITNSFEVLGTPSYMPPEQAAGRARELTPAADVYSLGAVFYHMLTGEPPFAGGTTYETIRMVLESEPRNPRTRNAKTDLDLAAICLKCLEKDPKKRYETAEALAQDVERWLRHEPIQARLAGIFVRGKKWLQRNPATAIAGVSFAGLVVAVSVIVSKSDLFRPPPTTGIAVLPFENLSESKADAFFADGIQDDILTRLAKIAGLKVISRTSVMEYRGRQNVRQIGDALRVSHVLEGSARRNGNRIHLSAQLIDARTDTHVWAEQYDRDLKDLFAIQSEIAQKVAAQLHAKVSSSEEIAIERKPTSDFTAYDLYTRALDMLKSNEVKGVPPAIDLLNQAVARDPSFFEAYRKLADAHDTLYFNEVDHTPARLALARAAIQEAFRLRPGAGEAHFAQAVHLYRGYRDYDGALAELEVARQTLPNDARIFQMMGNIQRRNGQWEEARQNLERAAELDPRDVRTLDSLSDTYQRLGRTAEERRWLTRAVAAAGPDNFSMQLRFAEFELDVNADPRPLHQAIESIRATNPAALRGIANSWLFCALTERDAAAATEALSLLKDNELTFFGWVPVNRPFMEALIARVAKDEQRAQVAFTAARAEQEKVVQAHPDFGPAWSVLGLIDAGLGRKEDALREGRRGIELLPIEKDASRGPQLVRYFAATAAWVGENDLACEQLATLVGPPNFLTYGNAKLLPFWDPLRGELCFEKIVNSLAPK